MLAALFFSSKNAVPQGLSVSAATPGEGLAFEEFEARAAAGGDVSDLVCKAGLVDGGDTVAAADDGGGVAIARYGGGDCVGPQSEGGASRRRPWDRSR